MSNGNKNHDPEDLDLDFGSFNIDEPPLPGGNDPFEPEVMPGPSLAKPARQAPSARDHFGDIDGEEHPHSHPDAAGGDDGPDFGAGFGRDDFGIPEDDQPEPVQPARPRANLRKSEPAVEEPDFGETGFEGAFGGPGEDPDEDPVEPVQAQARRARGRVEEEADLPEPGEAYDPDEGEEGEEPRSRFSFDPKKLMFPAVAAGIALFAGTMTWGYVGDMFFAEEAPTSRGALNQVTQAAPRPAPAPGGTLPPLGGLQSAQVPPLPAQGAQIPGLPAMPGTTGRIPPSAPVGTAAQPAMQNTAPPIAAAIAQPDPAILERIARLESQAKAPPEAPAGLGELEQKVRQLELRLAAAETREVPQPPRPDVSVPLKPQLIPGYQLSGYYKDTAWIKVPNGNTVEARIGTDLGQAGVVTGVSRYAKEFVVTTSVGVIMRN